jgi:hypothetical protein
MKTYIMATAAAFAVMGVLVSTSFTGSAFAHSHMTLTPDIENVNPISVVIGHTDEPTFGVKPGVHDGKHNLEVFLEDAETALPLSGANLIVDKYYFKDLRSFERASSLDRANQVETNVTVEEAFGEPGHYEVDQILQPGIYGYRLYGTIDYFSVANVSIDTTVFCSTDSGNTSKFNSEGWGGGYGCSEDINDLYWPNEPNLTRSTAADAEDDGLQLASTPMLQTLVVGATVAVGGFFGFRAFRNNK